MKKAKLLLPLVLLAAIFLTACANPATPTADPTQPSLPSTSETAETARTTESTTSTRENVITAVTRETVTETTEPSSSAPEKVQITVDYATDEILSNYDSLSEFIESEEISQKIIFTTNVRVKKISFIKVVYEEKNGEFAFFDNGELHSLEDFSPEKPFLVSWMDFGAIPHRGISFVDENDMTRYFYLATSGEDGSLILTEFHNE
jgi:hypothetical protein